MISRRRLVTGGVAAIAGGITIGVVGSQVLTPQSSLRAIGEGKSMVVLLDTDIERALFVLGDPNERVLENAVGISTVGNQRVDVLVATHEILASRSARAHLPIESAYTMCLQNHMTLPPIRDVDAVVMDNATVNLGDRMKFSVWIDQSVRVDDALNQPSLSIGITRGNVSVVMLGDAEAKMPPSQALPDILVVPDAADAKLTRELSPSLLLCTEGKRTVSANQMQVFWNDPVRIELGTEHIAYRRDQLWS